MVGNVWPTYRAEEYGIEFLEGCDAVWGDVVAFLAVRFGRPIELCEFEGEFLRGFGNGLQDFYGGSGDVDADAITRDGGDSEVFGRGHVGD